MKLPAFLLSNVSALSLLACCCGDPPARAPSSTTAPSVSPAAAPEPAPAPPPKVEEAVIEVSAATLVSAYKSNEVGADLKYKGKLVKVTGKVGDIKKDLMDNIYVTLGTGAMFEIPEVQAFFDDKDTMKAASLSKGQKITIVGRCEGLMMNVLVRDAKFVE